MKKTLRNYFGTETGYFYPDGKPVLIGDRISIMGTDSPATIRIRMNAGSLYTYATYSELGVTYARGLPRIAEEGFGRYVDKPKECAEPISVPKFRESVKGEYIIGLEDYDNAIFGNAV